MKLSTPRLNLILLCLLTGAEWGKGLFGEPLQFTLGIPSKKFELFTNLAMSTTKKVSFQDRRKENTPKFPSTEILYNSSWHQTIALYTEISFWFGSLNDAYRKREFRSEGAWNVSLCTKFACWLTKWPKWPDQELSNGAVIFQDEGFRQSSEADGLSQAYK